MPNSTTTPPHFSSHRIFLYLPFDLLTSTLYKAIEKSNCSCVVIIGLQFITYIAFHLTSCKLQQLIRSNSWMPSRCPCLLSDDSPETVRPGNSKGMMELSVG